ncbi:MAG: hypothetical protein AAF517_25935, partial [Planctomycetota bacterium]
LARLSTSADSPLTRFRADRVFLSLVESFLLDFETAYRSLDLDQRERAVLQRRASARSEYPPLKTEVEALRKKHEDLDEKVDTYLSHRNLEALAKKPRVGAAPPDSKRLAELKAQVDEIRREIPDLEEITKKLTRFYDLQSLARDLESQREVEELRLKELEERIEEREPEVASQREQIRRLGANVFGAITTRVRSLAIRETPVPGELRSPTQIHYEELLTEASRSLLPGSIALSEEEFERSRYQLAWCWRVAVSDEKSPHFKRAKELFEKHLDATFSDLSSSNSAVAERAAFEFYRLNREGLAGLLKRLRLDDAVSVSSEAGPQGFLASLLRWQVSPWAYARIGIHFGDFRKLPFPARRRRVFQYARAAGVEAIPTLRAIVIDDELETSFLVKYAAAKALATQLGDQLGYLVLKSLRPDMVMKRPEFARDLRLIQGLALVRAKNYSRAIEEFSQILDELPFDFEGNYHIAFAYLLIKNYAKSIHHFEVARRIRPKDQLTLYNLACAYSLAGKAKEAIEALDASVDAGFYDADHISTDPDLNPIRKEKGFEAVLRKARAKSEQSPR